MDRNRPTTAQRALRHEARDQSNDLVRSPQPLSPVSSTMDRVGVIFTWSYALCALCSMVWVLLPGLEQYMTPSSLLLSRGLYVYIAISAMLNWCLAVDLKSSQAYKDLLSTPQADWRYCRACQVAVPPRTHHCTACNVCILKHDHHCVFTGTCVGWSNQRRFIVFTLYSLIGCVCFMLVTAIYFWDSAEVWCQKWYFYLPAISLLGWLFGNIPLGHYLLLLGMHSSLIVLVTSGGFFIWEMLMTFRGQTSHEAGKNIKTYRTSPLDGFYSVFGKYGLLQFIIPLPIAMNSDGVNWIPCKGHV